MFLRLDCVWWVCWWKGDFEIELIAMKRVLVRFTRVHKLYKEMRSDPIWDNETIVIAFSPNSRGWTKIAFGYIQKGKQLLNPFVLTVFGAYHKSFAETGNQITVDNFRLLGTGIAYSIHVLGCELDNRGIGVQLLTNATDISLIQSVQTACSACPASCLMSYCSGIKRPRRDAEHPFLSPVLTFRNSGAMLLSSFPSALMTCIGTRVPLRGSAVGWGPALQTGRSWVWFPMV